MTRKINQQNFFISFLSFLKRVQGARFRAQGKNVNRHFPDDRVKGPSERGRPVGFHYDCPANNGYGWEGGNDRSPVPVFVVHQAKRRLFFSLRPNERIRELRASFTPLILYSFPEVLILKKPPHKRGENEKKFVHLTPSGSRCKEWDCRPSLS